VPAIVEHTFKDRLIDSSEQFLMFRSIAGFQVRNYLRVGEKYARCPTQAFFRLGDVLRRATLRTTPRLMNTLHGWAALPAPRQGP